MKNTKSNLFTKFNTDSIIPLKSNLDEKFDAYLFIDSTQCTIYAASTIGILILSEIETQIKEIKEKRIFAKNNIDVEKMQTLKNSITYKINEKIGKNEKQSFSEIALGIAYFCAILIYMLILLNGTNIMRSVAEEKTNKVVEIMVSSVRPRDIMMGKIIAVCLVGIIQILLWLMFILLISTALSLFLPSSKELIQSTSQLPMNNSYAKFNDIKIIMHSIQSSLDFAKLGVALFFSFVFGYLMYASLLAAIGNLVSNDPQEAQSLTLPITMPIILSIMMITLIISNPNGTLAKVLSFFPLTSPIILVARTPFDIPWWEIILSITIMAITFWMLLRFAGMLYKAGVYYTGTKVKITDIPKILKLSKEI